MSVSQKPRVSASRLLITTKHLEAQKPMNVSPKNSWRAARRTLPHPTLSRQILNLSRRFLLHEKRSRQRTRCSYFGGCGRQYLIGFCQRSQNVQYTFHRTHSPESQTASTHVCGRIAVRFGGLHQTKRDFAAHCGFSDGGGDLRNYRRRAPVPCGRTCGLKRNPCRHPFGKRSRAF